MTMGPGGYSDRKTGALRKGMWGAPGVGKGRGQSLQKT